MTRKRTRLSPEARRQQLVEIGARLFGERPFSDVWIEQVAEEAGVSRGLIYHYFPNKRDFYAEIVRYGMRESFAFSEPDEALPPDQWLQFGLDRLISFIEENAPAFRAINRGRFSVDEEIRSVVTEGRSRQIDRIVELVDPDGSDTVRLAVEGWVALFDQLVMEWLDGREIQREQLVELLAGTLIGCVVTGLRVDGDAERIKQIVHLAPESFRS